jgi:hypothetical protein
MACAVFSRGRAEGDAAAQCDSANRPVSQTMRVLADYGVTVNVNACVTTSLVLPLPKVAVMVRG